MSIRGELYCNHCCLAIDRQKHVVVKVPGTKGSNPEDYQHFHNRDSGDCYRKEMNQRPYPTLVARAAA